MRNVTVTRQNDDGTYDEVGMRNRFLCRLKTQRGIVNRCRRMRWTGKIRMEWANGYAAPYATTYAILEQS
jgi:hypothetical protein